MRKPLLAVRTILRSYIKENSIAVKVKLADLKYNSDSTRLEPLGEYDKMREKKHAEAILFWRTECCF